MTLLESHVRKLEQRITDLENIPEIQNILKKKHFGSVHKGSKTKEVVAQELKALLNQFKPNFLAKDEIRDYEKEIHKSVKDVYELNEEDQKWIFKQIYEFKDKIQKIIGHKI